MSTEAQILAACPELAERANRRNAQKSTGPHTSEGKATVSQNAVKHGLLARQNVLSSEKTRRNSTSIAIRYSKNWPRQALWNLCSPNALYLSHGG